MATNRNTRKLIKGQREAGFRRSFRELRDKVNLSGARERIEEIQNRDHLTSEQRKSLIQKERVRSQFEQQASRFEEARARYQQKLESDKVKHIKKQTRKPNLPQDTQERLQNFHDTRGTSIPDVQYPEEGVLVPEGYEVEADNRYLVELEKLLASESDQADFEVDEEIRKELGMSPEEFSEYLEAVKKQTKQVRETLDELDRTAEDLGIPPEEVEVPQYMQQEFDPTVEEIFTDAEDVEKNTESSNPEAGERVDEFGVESFTEEILDALGNTDEIIEKLNQKGMETDELLEQKLRVAELVKKFIEKKLGEQSSAQSADTLRENLSQFFSLIKSELQGVPDLEGAIRNFNVKGLDFSKLKKLASEGMDFMPVLGPIKMLVEAKKGRSFSGEKLSGWRKGLHALEGGAFLFLDLSGAGTFVKTATKGSQIGSKVFMRSAAVARKVGMSKRVYKPLFKTGRTILKNPAMSRTVDKLFIRVLKKRNQ